MRAVLVATLTQTPSDESLARLRGGADWLEVRADLVGDLDPDRLRDRFDGRLLYTLRSRDEGGQGTADPERRAARLAAAAERFDLVDLEAERDLRPALLDRVPASKRLISWHGRVAEPAELQGHLERMSQHPAQLYKLVSLAKRAQDEMGPLALLKSQKRDDVVAFAAGEGGTWTRLVAPYLGAPWVFAAAQGRPGAPGQPALESLVSDYGLPDLAAAGRLFGIVGNPVGHSLSPRLHNSVYRELGLAALYLPFRVESFGDFWLEEVESGSFEVLGFELAGLSVTAPHKEIALAVAGAASPLAERIGSANTLVRREGVWEAETTDPEGVMAPLGDLGMELGGSRAAVLGAGGAGRAAAFALSRAGSRVALVNRTEERARRVAGELGVGFLPWSEFWPEAFQLVVSALPILADGELPFEPDRLDEKGVVIDLAYLRDRPTPLVEAAVAAGRRAVDGREVLLRQAVPQFRLMTGQELPLDSGRRILGLEG